MEYTTAGGRKLRSKIGSVPWECEGCVAKIEMDAQLCKEVWSHNENACEDGRIWEEQ